MSDTPLVKSPVENRLSGETKMFVSEKTPLKEVKFEPKYIDSHTEGLHRPLCSRVCGSGSCRKALKNNRCPGSVMSMSITCLTYRFITNDGKIGHAKYHGGTVLQMAI